MKWAGGQRQLEKEILSHLPEAIDTYFEPFLGGGAVFFALAGQKRFRRAVIGDQNPELVTTYRAIRDDVEEVIGVLGRMKNSEEAYYATRAQKPRKPARVAARMIYLNRTGFNGLYRQNKSGGFNVPYGHYKKPRIADPDGLRAASAALQNVSILEGDFDAMLSEAAGGDAVYFDPPYLPLSSTSSFAEYHKLRFGVPDHIRLARLYADLQERQVCSVLSNSDTPETRRIFGAFPHEFVQARRNINSNGQRRGKINELLVFGHAFTAAEAMQKTG